MRLFYEAVSGLLGILLLAVFIVCVIAFSAGVTWIVVKVSPAKSAKRQDGGASPSRQ
jgi:hypothetical protein